MGREMVETDTWAPWDKPMGLPLPTVQDTIIAIAKRENHATDPAQIRLLTCALDGYSDAQEGVLEALALVESSRFRKKEKDVLQRQLLGLEAPRNEFERLELERFRGAISDYLEMDPKYMWPEMMNVNGYKLSDERFFAGWSHLKEDLTWHTPSHREGMWDYSILHRVEETHFGPSGEFIPPQRLAQRHISVTLTSGFSHFFFWMNHHWDAPPPDSALAATLKALRGEYAPEEMNQLRSLSNYTTWTPQNIAGFQQALISRASTISWDQLIHFASLANEYNVEWALAAMDWSSEEAKESGFLTHPDSHANV